MNRINTFDMFEMMVDDWLNFIFCMRHKTVDKITMLTTTVLSLSLFPFRLDYIFAYISENERGFRHLHYKSYRFGVRNSYKDETVWRCTAVSTLTNANILSNNRCNAKVSTRIINGYEMIRNDANPIHTCKQIKLLSQYKPLKKKRLVVTRTINIGKL